MGPFEVCVGTTQTALWLLVREVEGWFIDCTMAASKGG